VGFEEFERVLELLMEYGFHNHEYFDKLIDDYIVWRDTVCSLQRETVKELKVFESCGSKCPDKA